MKPADFFARVEAADALEGLGIDSKDPDAPAFVVKHGPSGLTTRIPVQVLEEVDWDVLEAILTGRREPLALQHMTRVVGYYSRVENWNKSKIGELKDRQRGNYSVSDVPVA